MSPIKNFCAQMGLSLEALARQAGVDIGRLKAAADGSARLTAGEARRVAAKSEGELTVNEILAWGDEANSASIIAMPVIGGAEAPIDQEVLARALFSQLAGLTTAGAASLEELCDLGAEAALNAYPALDVLTGHGPDDRLFLVLSSVIEEILKEAPPRAPTCSRDLARQIADKYCG